MIRLVTSALQPGMIIARDIFSAAGSLLLAKDVRLDVQLIRKLTNLGIDAAFVKHPFLEIVPKDVMEEETHKEIMKITRQTFENVQRSSTFNVAGIRESMKKIIEDAICNRHVLIQLTDIRTRDDYTFGHSINVCLLSVLIGIKMNLSQQQLVELSIGAILHDLGMALIPAEILQKTDPISQEDWQVITEHTKTGFAIMRKIGPIPLVSAHVAFQHHENYDGSGYPRKLAGDSIHRYARIVAVADRYDAITSDRPYRKAFLPHEAYDIMLASRGRRLDPAIVDLFLENVALYPVGTTVLLDTGEIGVVIEIYPKLPARPVIKAIVDKFGTLYRKKEKKLDLTKELTRFIVKVLRPEEIFALKSTKTEI